MNAFMNLREMRVDVVCFHGFPWCFMEVFARYLLVLPWAPTVHS